MVVAAVAYAPTPATSKTINTYCIYT